MGAENLRIYNKKREPNLFFNSLSEWRTKLQPVVDSVADLALVVVVVDAVVAVDAGPVDVERRTPRSGCQ